MDNCRIERGIALLLADRRANRDPFKSDFEGFPLDLVVIITDFNGMSTSAPGRTHFFRGHIAPIAGKAINHCAYDKMSPQLFGQSVKFVNVTFSVTDMDAPLRRAEQRDRLR